MKLKFEQLTAHLKKSLAAIYIISGDEPLLLQEASDQIIKQAQKHGFQQRDLFTINAQFNWNDLQQSSDSLSLFSEKKVIELRANATPAKAFQQALLDYCENINPDNLLLIRLPKLDARTQKSKWFQTVDKQAVFIQVWPINISQLPGWLQTRAKKQKITLSHDAAVMIAEQTEGNLLASQQVLDKLVLADDTAPTLEQIQTSLSTNSRYDVFALVDAVLQKDQKRYSRILQDLQTTAAEPTLIVWALSREIRQLIELKTSLAQGKQLEQAMRELFIWSTRKALLQNYLKQCRIAHLYQALQIAAETDLAIKGITNNDPWLLLLRICLRMQGQTQ